MWTLPLPDYTNALKELEIALTYVNGIPKHALTDEEKTLIQALYNRYETLQGKHEESFKNNTLLDATKNAIENGFSEVQEKGRLKELRSRLMLAADRCPCCGIETVTDLDHFLPYSIFKVLAVYSSNLVPLCHKCNNKKRALTNEDPGERFIHPYYVEIPENEPFLVAETSVDVKRLKVNFSIKKVESMSDELYTHLMFQSNRVNLNIRLQKEVNIFLMSIYTSLEKLYNDSESPSFALKDFLLENYRYFKKKMGLNDWHTALLYALANNDDFCQGGFRVLS